MVDLWYVFKWMFVKVVDVGFMFYMYLEIEFYLLKLLLFGFEGFVLVDLVGYFDNVLGGMVYDFCCCFVCMLEDLGILVEFSYYEGGFG